MCLRLGIFMLYKPQSDRKYRRVPCLCGHQHSQLDPYEETTIGKNILLINPIETAYEFGARLCNAESIVNEYGQISTSLVTLGFFAWLIATCSIVTLTYRNREAI